MQMQMKVISWLAPTLLPYLTFYRKGPSRLALEIHQPCGNHTLVPRGFDIANKP